MSQISAPSASRALVACVALVTVLTLSACGRDQADSSAAEQTTPLATAPAAATTPSEHAETEKQPEPDDTKRDTRASDPEAEANAARLAKQDPDTNPAPTTRTGKVKAALEKAGYDVDAFGATGQAESSLKIGPLMSVAFYRDTNAAQTDYANFKAAFDSPNAQGMAIRKGRRVYLIATPNATTDEQRAELRKVAKISEDAQK